MAEVLLEVHRNDEVQKARQVVDELEIILREGAFNQELSRSYRSALNVLGLFPERPSKGSDILRRIIVFVYNAEMVAKRIADGKGAPADIVVVVQNSSDISRLLAIFFQTLLAV